jgi:uncharacterized protein YwlG (UPF0340 family)
MIGRLISWFMNDIIVRTLANNKRFQGMALKIDGFLTKNKQVVQENYVKTGEKVLKENAAKVKESRAGVFAQTFLKEMKKEVEMELSKAKLHNKK